jgi:hypothetical protein
MTAQTKGVDVLGTFRRDAEHALNWNGRASEEARGAFRESQAAIAAIDELIEADKEYDAALSALSDGPRPELSATSMNAWADEWGRVAQRADLRERLQSAKERRAAALARIGGAK